jgi:hypothetical protein
MAMVALDTLLPSPRGRGEKGESWVGERGAADRGGGGGEDGGKGLPAATSWAPKVHPCMLALHKSMGFFKPTFNSMASPPPPPPLPPAAANPGDVTVGGRGRGRGRWGHG